MSDSSKEQVVTKTTLTVIYVKDGKESFTLCEETEPRLAEGVLTFMAHDGVVNGIPLTNILRYRIVEEVVH